MEPSQRPRDANSVLDLRSEARTDRVVVCSQVNPVGAPIGSASIARRALKLEYETFLGAGYVDTASDLEDEYRPYSDASTFMSVARDGQMAGVARIIDASPAGFKTLNDIAAGRLTQDVEFPFEEPAQCFEVGTLSIQPEHRHSIVGLLLYGAMLWKSRHEDKRFLLASFDDGPTSSFLRDFEVLFTRGVTRLGPPTDYMGSPTTPVVIDMMEAYRGLNRTIGVDEFLDSVVLTEDPQSLVLSRPHITITDA